MTPLPVGDEPQSLDEALDRAADIYLDALDVLDERDRQVAADTA